VFFFYLMILSFQHILYISAEALTPQLKAKEERQLEKRKLKQQQQQLQQENNNNSSKATAGDAPKASETDDRTLLTPEVTASLKRKRSQQQKSSDGVKKQKVSANPSNDVKPASPAAAPALVNGAQQQPQPLLIQPPQQQQQQLPKQPQQLQQPQKVENVVPTAAPVPSLPQQPLPNFANRSDTVLVRLSSGQVVLVPRDLLRKVNPTVTAGNVPATTAPTPTPRMPTVPVPATPANKLMPVGVSPFQIRQKLEPPQMQAPPRPMVRPGVNVLKTFFLCH